MDLSNTQLTLLAALIGASGGIAEWLIQYFREEYVEQRDKKKVYSWLDANVGLGEFEPRWRATKVIASHTNLTQERTVFICSIHPDIVGSTGSVEDIWTVTRVKQRDN